MSGAEVAFSAAKTRYYGSGAADDDNIGDGVGGNGCDIYAADGGNGGDGVAVTGP